MGSLLEIEKLNVSFTKKGRHINALNGLDLRLDAGSVLAVVGESGSGKTTLAMSILGLLDRETLSGFSGRILYKGTDLTGKSSKEMNKIRGSEISMIFQEPQYALNPAVNIGRQIEELLIVHKKVGKADRRKRVYEIMEGVGLPDPPKYYNFRPSQLSGGMKQRAVIAMAMVCEPSIIIADEPTTALDVTTQAQILSLLKNLKAGKNISIILITHDLGVVAELADCIAVVYLGNLLEYGSVGDVLKDPRHPYTLGLLKCIPYADQKQERLYTIPRPELNASGNMQKGCSFYPRCAMRQQQCSESIPELLDAGSHHLARCPLWADVKTKSGEGLVI